jgi:hypothetical protein
MTMMEEQKRWAVVLCENFEFRHLLHSNEIISKHTLTMSIQDQWNEKEWDLNQCAMGGNFNSKYNACSKT